IFKWFHEKVIPQEWRLTSEVFVEREEAKREKNRKDGDLYDLPYKGYKTRIGRMFCRMTEKTQGVDLPPPKDDPEDKYGVKKAEEYRMAMIKSQYSLADSENPPKPVFPKAKQSEILSTVIEKIKRRTEFDTPSRTPATKELNEEIEEEEDLPF
ncbi:MAG: hypothetical protein LUC43_03535, partial [Burkholderiales bacterium]|nr:hypothetical protein [Burkholderiales bacterium]